MSDTDTPLPEAGWYPDPTGLDLLRWWDGEQWVEQYRARPMPKSAATPLLSDDDQDTGAFDEGALDTELAADQMVDAQASNDRHGDNTTGDDTTGDNGDQAGDGANSGVAAGHATRVQPEPPGGGSSPFDTAPTSTAPGADASGGGDAADPDTSADDGTSPQPAGETSSDNPGWVTQGASPAPSAGTATPGGPETSDSASSAEGDVAASEGDNADAPPSEPPSQGAASANTGDGGQGATGGSQPPPAWYTDPSGRFEHRYWDGNAWTPNVASGGVQSVDTTPLG